MLKEIGKEALKPLSYEFRESEPILSWCWGNTSGTFRHTVSVLYRLFDPKWGDDLQNEHRVWKKTWILRLKHKLLRNLLTDVINQESFIRDFYRNWLLLTSTESPSAGDFRHSCDYVQFYLHRFIFWGLCAMMNLTEAAFTASECGSHNTTKTTNLQPVTWCDDGLYFMKASLSRCTALIPFIALYSHAHIYNNLGFVV